MAACYQICFREDFMSRTGLYIAFLTIALYLAIARSLVAVFLQGKKKNTEFMFAGMWAFVFVVNLASFI